MSPFPYNKLPDGVVLGERKGGTLYVDWDQETGVWTSPNISELVRPIPPPINEKKPYEHLFKRVSGPVAVNDRYLWLAFWPNNVFWDGPVFGVLDFDETTLPFLTTPNDTFYLDRMLVKKWQDLEFNLTRAIAVIHPHLLFMPPTLSLTSITRFPSRYEYEATYKTHAELIEALMGARHAFLALATYLSFLVAVYAHQKRDQKVLPWPELLNSHSGFRVFFTTFGDGIKDSQIMSFHAGLRAGGYIAAGPTNASKLFYIFDRACVPLFIHWGTTPYPYYADVLRLVRWRPTVEEVNQAERKTLRRARFHDHHENDSPVLENLSIHPTLDQPETFDEPPHDGDWSPLPTSPNWEAPWTETHDEPTTSASIDLPSLPPIEVDTGDQPANRSQAADAEPPFRMTPPSEMPTKVNLFQAQNKPHHGSNQLPGEDYDEFHERLSKESVEFLALLSAPEINEIRSKATQAAAESRQPQLGKPTVGSKIFFWMRNSHQRPIRVIVPVDKWHSRWMKHPMRCRRYLWHLDQWDLADLHDGDDGADSSDEDEDIARISTLVRKDPLESFQAALNALPPKVPVSDVAPAVAPIPPSPSSTLLNDSTSLIPTPSSTLSNTQPSHSYTESRAAAVFRLRYGFILRESLDATGKYIQDPRFTSGLDEKKVLAATISRNSVLNRFGLINAQPLDDAEIHAARDLYNFSFASTSCPPAIWSGRCWNYGPDLVEYILDHPVLQLIPVTEPIPSVISFHNSTPPRVLGYILAIRPKEGTDTKPLDKQFYLLALNDPTSVLHAFREPFTTFSNIVRSLIQWRIPFATVRFASRPPDPRPRNPQPLGWRNAFRQYTNADYNNYIQRRNTLLRGPQGRAALKYGGLISRIASEVVQVSTVVRGVRSPDWTWNRFGDKFLVDDGLNQDDLDIICGTYYINTPSGVQTISWYPPARIWEYGSYNLGYWSDDAEQWYVGWSNELQSNTKPQPQSGKDWRQFLRKRTTGFANINAARKKIGAASEAILLGRSMY